MSKLQQHTQAFTQADKLKAATEQQLNLIRERALLAQATTRQSINVNKEQQLTAWANLWQPALAFSICCSVLLLSHKLSNNLTNTLDQNFTEQYASQQLYQDLQLLADNNDLEFLTDLEVANWLEAETDNGT
jgi:hypothetical protein